MAKKRIGKSIPIVISPYVWGYLVTLQKQGVPIERAYLFGSWAKGVEHKDSDVDLAVISPAFTSWSKKNRLLAKAKYLDFVDIEPHGFHPDELKEKSVPLVYEILKDGIQII